MRPRADERPLDEVYAAAYAAAYDRTRLPQQRAVPQADPGEPAPVAGPTAAPARTLRPRRWAWVAAGLVIGTFVGLALVTHGDDAGSPQRRSGSTLSRADAAVVAGLPPGGSRVRATVRADGTLSVEEWARRTSSGAGSHRVFTPRQTAQSSSSAPGRALAQVAPDPGGATGTRIVTVEAREVLSLACLPRGAGAVAQPCGRPNSTGSTTARSWTVRLAGARAADTVLAQVDLG